MEQSVDFSQFLLVYPRTPDTYWSYRYALSFVGKRALMPPLGLATIAAMIPERYGCRVLDLNVEELTDDDILSSDLVLVSAMIVQRDSFHEVVARCNRLGVPVAAGGPYPTSCPEEMPGVDYLVLNEGELTFPRFLQDWLSGSAVRVYRDTRHPELNTSPVPRFSILHMEYYDTLPLQYSRGCPFNCDFCDIVHLFGNVPRTKTPEQFVRELDAAYATGFRGSVFVVDDNFIGNRKEVKRLLPLVAEWQRAHRMPFGFSTEADINLAADDELLDMLVDAGFTMAFVGIETPVRESLALAGKRQNLRTDTAAAVRKIQERGIEVSAGFIIGFDTDPVDVFDQQIAFVAELAVPVAMVGTLMALPHTRLWDRLETEGRLLGKSDGNNTHGSLINFRTILDPHFLIEGYHRILREIYRPRNFFNRCLALLRRYPKRLRNLGQPARVRIGFRELYGLAKSLSRQTFSRYGLSYLHYLAKALVARPAQAVRIFTMAIQGHHFFTITRMQLGSMFDNGAAR
ncbi:MAG TPA: radical SAM protein [Spirochaetia bacterium]|nr:radical SAM protein [Spirochaetia bacterium]